MTAVLIGDKARRADVFAVMVFVRAGFIGIEALTGIEVVDFCRDSVVVVVVVVGAVCCFELAIVASRDIDSTGTYDSGLDTSLHFY